jgi:glycosidase
MKAYLISQTANYFSEGVFFVENHDDNRAAGTSSQGGVGLGSLPRALAASMVTSTLPGMKLFYHGQLQGLGNKMDVHLRRTLDTNVPLNNAQVLTSHMFVDLFFYL